MVLSPTPRSAALITQPPMLKSIPYVAASFGAWAGWVVGRQAGLFAAYMLAIIGIGLGIYLGRRLVKRIVGE
jgi:hypothetical protein